MTDRHACTIRFAWSDADGDGMWVLTDDVGTTWGSGTTPLAAFRDWCVVTADCLAWDEENTTVLAGPARREWEAWQARFAEVAE